MRMSLLLCLVVSMTTAAIAQPRTPDAPPLPTELRPGEMLWQDGSQWHALPLLSVEVELAVTGVLARGRVRQRFINRTPEVIDATYVFPLAEKASVDSMQLQIGERTIHSVIQEKARARETFAVAQQSGRKAALLESRTPNLFSTRVANINPGESVEVVFEYLDQVEFDGTRFRLALPLAYTERYRRSVSPASVPRGEECRAAGRPEVQISVQLRMGIELESIESTSHPLQIVHDGATVHVTPAAGTLLGDRDFLLEIRPRLSRVPELRLLVESDYALAMLYPPHQSSALTRGLPTETLFVIDISGSMDGPSIVQARRALVAALMRLRPEDRFNVMAFNNLQRLYDAGFRQADRFAVAEAVEWVQALAAHGGTEIADALDHALSLAGEARGSHAQRIIFLTDGAVHDEATLLSRIALRRGELRLHAIGIGAAPNRYLLRKMAELGHGLCEFVSADAAGSSRIGDFLERVDRPLFTELELSWQGFELQEMFPPSLPDLHIGQSWAVLARLRTGDSVGKLRLTGHGASGWFEREADAQWVSGPQAGISKRWARAKIDSIFDQQHAGRDPESIRREVIELALDHQLVTRHTSLVAVDDRPSALGSARPLRIAGVLPRGGSDGPLRRLLALIFVAIGAIGCGLVRR